MVTLHNSPHPPTPSPTGGEGEKVDAAIAMLTAKRLIGMIKDDCERVEIAGSLRRNKPEVKDVEIVVIPKPELFTHLDKMIENGVITKAEYGAKKLHRWGDKYRGLIFDDVKIEIFSADADNWGYQLWLRTGPAEGGETFMKAINSRSGIRAIDGYLWTGSKWHRGNDNQWTSPDSRKLSIPDEAAFFGLIGIEPVSPAWRSPLMYQPLWKKDHQWGDATSYIKKVIRNERYDDTRYGMLPSWSAQRCEYENSTPVLWKHRLLAGWIAEMEAGADHPLLLAYRERFKEGVEAIEKGTMRE
jgi:hypothetical protein